jgi:hypothetical protein
METIMELPGYVPVKNFNKNLATAKFARSLLHRVVSHFKMPLVAVEQEVVPRENRNANFQ